MKLFWTISSLMLAAFCASACWAVPTYRIEALGLTDAIHTHNGENYGYAELINEAGHVVGTSSRFVNGASAGDSAWLFDGTQTVDISPVGSDYVSGDGVKYAHPVGLNEHGAVVGLATLWPDQEETGLATWLYDGSVTREIGLVDEEHTRSDGYRYSDFDPDGVVIPGKASLINSSNQAIGISSRYNGSEYAGRSAWIFDGAATQKIGVIDAEHTRADGFRESAALALNDAGQAIGWSKQYIPGIAVVGQTGWLYDSGDLIQLGLSGAEHMGSLGLRYTFVSKLNSAGLVIGASRRFEGTTNTGQSAWIFDGVTTTTIGLYDSEHFSNSGLVENVAIDLNESGQVVGVARRYNGGSDYLGSDAWLFDGTETVKIGLLDAEHTSATGRRENYPLGINASGRIIGTAYQYSVTGDDRDDGISAWYFDGNTSKQIGLLGAAYVWPAGQLVSVPRMINEAGQAAGFSARFLDGENSASDAWFYDAELDQTFPLVLSSRSDGLSYSYVTFLSNDGYAIGNYMAFDEHDNSLGYRAFYFSVADGLHDLGSLVEGGLTASGWDSLSEVYHMNSAGQIVGYGDLTGGPVFGSTAFLLTPITADFNNDGHVDGRDFLAWQRGESPRPLSAADLALWQKQYADGNSLDVVSVIPEPNGLALVLCSLILAARLRMR